MEGNRLEELRAGRPLLHCLSNFVTANDCANAALAVGASPVMAWAPEEAEAVTAAARATVLNTGTPDEDRFAACRTWGLAAARLGRPLVLDPVGAGADPWRLARVRALLADCAPAILRVNADEARALTGAGGGEQGVDSAPVSRDEQVSLARTLSERTGAAVLLSGREDVAWRGGRGFAVSGGSVWMTRVTGTGCMLSVLCGAFAAVEPDALEAAALAAVFWKLCARTAESASGGRGSGSFRAALLDAASTLCGAELSAAAASCLTSL